MPRTTLYLARHGHADGDTPGSALTAEGRAQAGRLGHRLRGVPFTAVHHSPLRRAAETAAILAAYLPGVPVHACDLVTDRTPVPSPGREPDYPQRYRSWLDQVPPAERDPDAAALHDAVTRLLAVGAEDRTDLLVTHNFVIGWFVRHVLDACSAARAMPTSPPAATWWAAYGSVARVRGSFQDARSMTTEARSLRSAVSSRGHQSQWCTPSITLDSRREAARRSAYSTHELYPPVRATAHPRRADHADQEPVRARDDRAGGVQVALDRSAGPAAGGARSAGPAGGCGCEPFRCTGCGCSGPLRSTPRAARRFRPCSARS
ncbi:histidine phosphatase family protein [Dactylosporangium aurantiacum]|uniref:Histidine phosphatase family protein n=1 Tax=Dactylosporangium aurantiacum TaxID=35754 RepID=A0A9Q9MHK2_9ACTN|nr:histidine phosphatase family protein [Dactylosporangium aurantiacum]MDG6104148.1 histidine phosphatase family protein [Dactylosporangium aurantiacum]UWZ56844.1 histidine phosphatase family protein [Dactylosporangium aurantiacum]